ncbi:variant erythrocyte surface antigen-1 family protein, partial [Babesia divergens]
MYYTDVFVGQTDNNINNLKKALDAELKGSGVKPVDLTALASGLQSFLTGIKQGGSYASSYDSNNVTWKELCEECKCKSNSHSCSCSTSGSQTVCSNPSQCCPDCDVRKAAKIFLGFLPSLYYALKYLYDKCKGGGGWSSQNINNKDSSLSRFLVGMGYNVDKELIGTKTGQEIFTLLSSLLNDSKGSLDIVYKEVKKYFTSFYSRSLVPSSDSDSKPKDPLTVRDILLWLSGLPFASGFKALLLHCKGLCKPVETSKNSVTPENFESYLFDSCFLSPFVLGVIEEPTEEAFENFPPYASEWQNFSYPEDPFKLFETFCEYVRKIFVALIFLKFQCERPSDQAGWQNCYFGQKCSVDPLSSGSVSSPSTSPCCSTSAPNGYLCTASGQNKDVHSKHCASGSCLGFGSGSTSCSNGSSHNKADAKSPPNSKGKPCKPCPHHLVRFLLDGSSDSDSKSTSPSSPFKTPDSFARLDFSQSPPAILDASSDKDFLTMGFLKKNLPKKARQGNSIAPILNSFCGSNTSPLTKLFEFSLFVAMRPPETLIELYAFFVKFRFSGFLDDVSNYASMEPGTPDGSALKTAIEKLDDFSGHPSGDHPADLKSLYACDVPTSISTCGRYLYPLYNINGVFTKEFCAVYLSWVCHLGKALKALLEKFHKEAHEKFSCCLSSSCEKIVTCPCALPFLYTYGFTFYQPEKLNCHGTQSGHTPGQGQNCILKSCKNFLDQLGKVISGDPLQALLDAIDAFLWSIREPFFFFILAFWAFVISYFFYVQLYKLDLFHLKSHAHFSRSFKILPSTLFSDASSKFKDLSYFTL